VASKTFKLNKNIGGNTGNAVSTGRGQTFEFDIPETGDYVLTFYTDAKKNADFVLGMATLEVKSFVETGIKELDYMTINLSEVKKGCFDLSGRQVSIENLKPGLYIMDGRKVAIK
jgi:hypothetical protein